VVTLSRRTRPPSDKRAAVEAAVLEAAAGLLAEGASFADLSVERIATRAGISRTAFYFYFRDKRELLMRLTEDVADELYAVAEGWWSGAGDGRADLDRTIRAILAVYEAQGALLRAVVQSAGYDEPVAAFWRALMGRFVDATERRITAGPQLVPEVLHRAAVVLARRPSRRDLDVQQGRKAGRVVDLGLEVRQRRRHELEPGSHEHEGRGGHPALLRHRLRTGRAGATGKVPAVTASAGDGSGTRLLRVPT